MYDIAIIGGGPAGMTAGLYAARARMKTVLLEKMACGGQMLLTHRVENFPGFPNGVTGVELADWMAKQAEHFGLEVRNSDVKSIGLPKGAKKPFAVELTEKAALEAVAVIVATGARWNSLGIPGEYELAGRGVSYCGVCDGPLFKGKEVVVVGGGDTAIEDALFLTKFASKVTIIHRRDRLRATKILQERAFSNQKITFHLNSTATSVLGKERVEGIKIKDVTSGKETTVAASGVFVLIGLTPNSDIVKGIVKLDDKGYIVADDQMRTSVDGIFSCGDVRKKALRQVVTAAGDGAAAAFSAEQFVERLRGTEYK